MKITEIDLKENSIKVVLASQSARRKEILENHGISPVIMPMDVDETLPSGIAPSDAVMFLSLKKGLACLEQVAGDPVLIVAADTVVFADGVIFGKPHSEDEAWRMLTAIRGASHHVMTGVTLIYACSADGEPGYHAGADKHVEPADNHGSAAGGLVIRKRAFYDDTEVFVDEISDADLKAYIDSGEPFGKAGGYAIQLGFGKYIDHIEGDYENVVGLPYNHIIEELSRF